MAHRIITRHEAEVDITDAAIWYEQKQPMLGQEFVAEVDSAIALAAANPFAFSRLRRKPEVRRVLTRRFPYRVFFIRRDDAIVVFRVLHAARHDRHWKSSVPKE
ncbi:MAG TPA: type II toxin-antitoxin system RelE/ParE family toxin [Tepidisphaeraceae bacterium]|jgi:plasmid stabilization system protein ParE|nr:type II toxin-antitoxin system RelE/ParE family toxin [Tepidisphaeraceae bacterium]